MKKVLFISPTPTHETNAGNRLHIKSLASFFKEQQCRVDFLFLQYEDADMMAMNLFFEDRLVVVPRDVLFASKKTLSYIKRKGGGMARQFYRRMQYRFEGINQEQLLHNREVDSYFPFSARKILHQQAKEKYDIVVCEYASMSRALDFFDKDVFKILDTHDVFTDRYKVYLDNNLPPEWISLYKDQEKKALMRADLIIAVDKTDKAYFTQLMDNNVVIFNAIPDTTVPPIKSFGKTILYIGGGNEMNVTAITSFIRNVFPKVLLGCPEANLLIGGEVGKYIDSSHSNIIVTGNLNNLNQFYAKGDIVINPEVQGTGYKVKALEALAFGKPLVTTVAGAKGVTEPFSEHLRIVSNDAEFAFVLLSLLNNPQEMQTLSENAHDWVKRKKAEMEASLMAELPGFVNNIKI